MEAAANNNQTDHVRVVRVGRRVLIPLREIERRLGGQPLSARWADKEVFTVPEFAEIFRLSLWSAYQAVKAG